MNIDEREWQAQEQARRDEVAGISSSLANSDFRKIAHALRQSPPPALPIDFASRVATLAAVAPVLDLRLERWITRVLSGVFAVVGVSCLAIYDQDWLQAAGSLLPAGGDSSSRSALAAVALCAAMTWCIGRLGERQVGTD